KAATLSPSIFRIAASPRPTASNDFGFGSICPPALEAVAPIASSADFGPAAGLMRVASNISSQRFSLPTARSGSISAAAVPLLMPHAPKPIATRDLSPLDDDQPTNGAQSVELPRVPVDHTALLEHVAAVPWIGFGKARHVFSGM